MEIQKFLELIREKKPELVTIDSKDSVDKAIELMLKNNYSQLPIMKADKMIGAISYESLAKNVFNYKENKSKIPSKLRVRDFMEKTSKIYSNQDDVVSLLETLAEKSFVVIMKRNKVTDIITNYDALRFFRAYGKDFFCTNTKSSL